MQMTILIWPAVWSCLVLSGCGHATLPSRLTINQLADRYRDDTNPDRKRDLCIEAIDLGYITSAAPLENVRRLFGTDFQEHVAIIGNGHVLGKVRFAEIPQATGDAIEQLPYTGWYLDIDHRGDQIYHYSLSNQSK